MWCILYPLQLRPGLHWGDQTETRDETEGTPRCLREGDGEVSRSEACMGESPSNRLGGDHSAGPWQRTRAVGEGGPAHPDYTLMAFLDQSMLRVSVAKHEGFWGICIELSLPTALRPLSLICTNPK